MEVISDQYAHNWQLFSVQVKYS